MNWGNRGLCTSCPPEQIHCSQTQPHWPLGVPCQVDLECQAQPLPQVNTCPGAHCSQAKGEGGSHRLASCPRTET